MSTVKISLPWKKPQHKLRGNRVADGSALESPHPPKKMSAIIERERTRSDRSGTGFSILMVSVGGARRDKVLLTSVADFLQTRVRSTDDIGWLDDNRLCVVLSATLPTGARKVAEAIQNKFVGADTVECQLYYYPSHDDTDDDSDSDNSDSIDDSESQGAAASAEPMHPLFAPPMRSWKRSLDIVGAVTAAILLSPLLLLAAIAIRIASPGPILFGQLRSGRGGAPFLMYKFRSMVVDAEEKKGELLAQNEQDGPAFKLRLDPRITRVGRFLRNTSIDELPQLWNVLKGEMSLVGPRPLPCDETANCQNWHRRRVDVKPGMTCIWQLQGRSRVSFDDWVRMDISYIRKLSLAGDVKLLAGTLPVLIWRRSGC